jgi:hypothetical protein
MIKIIKNWIRQLLCDVMDEHVPDVSAGIGSDGVSWISYCKRCHKRILRNSQGGWFAAFTQDDVEEKR